MSKVCSLGVRNFRLLSNVKLCLESGTTLIVGRNNSGKTSLAEIVRRFVKEERSSFHLEDFSLAAQAQFERAFDLWHITGDEEKVREILPEIELEIGIRYSKDSEDFGPLSEFIIDLDVDSDSAIVLMKYRLEDGKIQHFFKEIASALEAKKGDERSRAFFKEIRPRILKFYRKFATAIDPTDASNQKPVDLDFVRRLIRVTFINAQRGLDDDTVRNKSVLGDIFVSIFESAKSDLFNSTDRKIAADLAEAVKEVEGRVDERLRADLRKLVPELVEFGYPGLKDPGLLTETSFAVEALLNNHTKICYEGVNGVNLPEAFNGLGSRNLIFMMLKLLEFFKVTKNHEGINLVFIEEPEAHLHPQMQEVFIEQLDNICRMFSRDYNDDVPWSAQFVVSTHSSHVANAASFNKIRYFLSDDGVSRIKDLRQGYKGLDDEFLHKYLTLTRCDLFFADKAVLVEGASERLLLPSMINKVEAEHKTVTLSKQYLTVLETGGAYSHLFFALLDFLELKSAIITDMDTTVKNGGEKCIVSDGKSTSNAAIKNWFDSKEIGPNELLQKVDDDKIIGRRRLAFQVPESSGMPCGRSLEQAFVLANLSKFDIKNNAELEKSSWSIVEKVEKTDFALKFAIRDTDWSVPVYIKEALIWLSGNEMAAAIEPSVVKSDTKQTRKPRSKKSV